jgi:hypothetical protein
VSRHVRAVGRALLNISKDYAVHQLWLQLDGIQSALRGDRPQRGGGKVLQRSPELPERCALRSDDVHVLAGTHFLVRFVVILWVLPRLGRPEIQLLQILIGGISFLHEYISISWFLQQYMIGF